MATPKKTRIVIADEQPEYEDVTFSNAAHLDQYQPADAALCPVCGELLAWHEQACDIGPAQQPEEELAVPQVQMAGYAYALGHRVQPAAQAPAHSIIWRGQLRERHPRTGMVHRVNVYRLSDGYWDCYREEELQAA